MSRFEAVSHLVDGRVSVTEDGKFTLNRQFIAGDQLGRVLVDVRAGHCGGRRGGTDKCVCEGEEWKGGEYKI